MKAFAISTPGLESVSALEVKELVSAAATAAGGIVLFPVKKFEELCVLSYRAQSVSRVCYLICDFKVETAISATAANFSKSLTESGFKISEWLANGNTFSVECSRYGVHSFTSQDFSAAAVASVSKLLEREKISASVVFKSPSLPFFCYISGDKGFFGIDVAGFDLSKRDYRIHHHSNDLKSTTAYSLVRLSGFGKGSVLLDPFSRSGAIAIEAAMFASGFPVNYYRRDSFSFLKLKLFSSIGFSKFFAAVDKRINGNKTKIHNYSSAMPNISFSEKNARISGVNKLIDFSRVNVEWLETKFNRNSVDAIVSYPPLLSRSADASAVRKLYREFFYQAGLILSKKGRIVLAAIEADALSAAAQSNNFGIDKSFPFSAGQQGMVALVFARS